MLIKLYKEYLKWSPIKFIIKIIIYKIINNDNKVCNGEDICSVVYWKSLVFGAKPIYQRLGTDVWRKAFTSGVNGWMKIRASGPWSKWMAKTKHFVSNIVHGVNAFSTDDAVADEVFGLKHSFRPRSTCPDFIHPLLRMLQVKNKVVQSCWIKNQGKLTNELLNHIEEKDKDTDMEEISG